MADLARQLCRACRHDVAWLAANHDPVSSCDRGESNTLDSETTTPAKAGERLYGGDNGCVRRRIREVAAWRCYVCAATITGAGGQDAIRPNLYAWRYFCGLRVRNVDKITNSGTLNQCSPGNLDLNHSIKRCSWQDHLTDPEVVTRNGRKKDVGG